MKELRDLKDLTEQERAGTDEAGSKRGRETERVCVCVREGGYR